MRLLLALFTLSGCVDDPCHGVEGPVLRVVPEHLAEGSDARRFTSISDALAVAEPGTSVCVAPGKWREPVRLYTPDVRLIGPGPELATLSPAHPPQDPRESDDTVVALGAEDVRISGFTVTGGARGVWIESGVEVRASDLRVEGNATGLLATDPRSIELNEVEISHNVVIGALVTAVGDAPELRWIGGALEGNGDASVSEVGGLYSDGDVHLSDLRIRDNAGALAADVFTWGELELEDSRLDRPMPLQASPRLMSDDGAVIRGLEAHVAGSPLLRTSCREGSRFAVENLAATDTQAGVPLLELDGCTGLLAHLTLVELDGDGPATALGLTGAGQLELVNSALIGYATPIAPEGWPGSLHVHDNFQGDAAEAALLGPLLGVPDLRPQSDSPLVDAGVEVGVTQDLAGQPRPSGPRPDIGAYELY